MKRSKRKLALYPALAFLAAPLLAPAAPDPVGEVNALADELLMHLSATSAYVRLQSNLPINEFDPITLGRAQQETQFSKRMLQRLDRIDLVAVPHDQWLLARMLDHTFRSGSLADQNYWFDFAVVPYAGGQVINGDHVMLAGQLLATSEERQQYLRLLDSYAKMLEQIAAKTRMQAERGIRVPQPAIPGVIATFRALQASVDNTLVPSLTRLRGVPAPDAKSFNEAVRKRLNDRIVPGYVAIIALFDESYTRSAPADVGLRQYPGGKERYLRAVSDFTGSDLTPQQIHDLGERRTSELDRRMQEIRDQLGFKGTREAFETSLRKDPRFLARSPADVEKRYLGYLARIKPFLPQYFLKLPQAPYVLRRLAPAAEKGMTYGYYDPPSPTDPQGVYYYNGSDLSERSLVTAEHLIYHELMPGHHLQVALQLENSSVHPVRKFLDYGAYSEGWAEYAASLAEQMGLYSDPYDLYGHLLMQSFLTTRLVVDTGMNYLGMSLVEARAYMKAHTFESDAQIDSETLRYSTDIHGQALCYRLGFEKFWELRSRAERALGKRFDLRKFHAAAIGEGAMPLDVLDRHIDWFITQSSH
jgi:uncharacterized protein (DUF885 family)